MNNAKHLSVSMTRGETLWGWLYLALELLFLGWGLQELFRLLQWDTSSTYGAAILNGAYFSVNFIMCILIFRKFLLKNLAQIGKRFWGFVQAVLLGLIMYYVGLWLVNTLVNQFAPGFANVNDASVLTMAQAARWIMIPGTVLFAPLAEECFLRGLVFQGCFRKNRIAAYILSTGLFALLHILNYIGQYPLWQLALCVLQYVPAGVALGWAYEKADSIFAPIFMHCVINSVSLGLLM